MRGVEGQHSSDRGVGWQFSLAPSLPMHTHNPPTNSPPWILREKVCQTDASSILPWQSSASRAVHCALVTRALLYTVYTSSSTDVFLIFLRLPEPLSEHTSKDNACGFYSEYFSPSTHNIIHVLYIYIIIIRYILVI